MTNPEADRNAAMQTEESVKEIDSQAGGNRRISGKIRKGLSRLSGAGEISKAVGGSASDVRNSSARIGGMFASVFGSDRLETEVPDRCGDMHDRFKASMQQHRIDKPKLARMVRNTRRSFLLYLALLAFAFSFGSVSFYLHAPDSVLSGLIRFAAVPLLAALAFKHAYSNWLFRNRRLSTPIEYFKSGDLWPRATGRQFSELKDEPDAKIRTGQPGNPNNRCNSR